MGLPGHGGAYSTAHAALPTDAGYGMAVGGAGSVAHAGYHQTQAVSGSVYAARGAAVRNSYNGYGLYGSAWRRDNPGAGSRRAGGSVVPGTQPPGR